MYLLYGTNNFLISEYIKKLEIKLNIEAININKYNYNESNIVEILDDLSTVSLFSEKKLVIINDYSNNAAKDKVLLEYLKKNQDDSVLILILNSNKINNKNKIIKHITEFGKIVELNKLTNVISYATNLFKPYNISSELIKYFINRVGNDTGILTEEIKKIKIYKDLDMDITKEDIDSLTNKNIDLDIFNLIDNIINKNKTKAIESYNEMMLHGSEPIAILVMLANQFRIIYQSKVLSKDNLSYREIGKILDIHEYRVKKALEKAYIYKEEELINIIEQFAVLDFDIKTGRVNKQIGVELLILSL